MKKEKEKESQKKSDRNVTKNGNQGESDLTIGELSNVRENEEQRENVRFACDNSGKEARGEFPTLLLKRE